MFPVPDILSSQYGVQTMTFDPVADALVGTPKPRRILVERKCCGKDCQLIICLACLLSDDKRQTKKRGRWEVLKS